MCLLLKTLNRTGRRLVVLHWAKPVVHFCFCKDTGTIKKEKAVNRHSPSCFLPPGGRALPSHPAPHPQFNQELALARIPGKHRRWDLPGNTGNQLFSTAVIHSHWRKYHGKQEGMEGKSCSHSRSAGDTLRLKIKFQAKFQCSELLPVLRFLNSDSH